MKVRVKYVFLSKTYRDVEDVGTRTLGDTNILRIERSGKKFRVTNIDIAGISHWTVTK